MICDNELLSPNEASRLLGGKVSANCLRQQVYQGRLDLGAVKVPRKDGKTRLYFPKDKILKWVGKEEELKQEYPSSEKEPASFPQPIDSPQKLFSKWCRENKTDPEDLADAVKAILAKKEYVRGGCEGVS